MPWAPDYVDAAALADYLDDAGDGSTLLAADTARLTGASKAACRAVDTSCSGAIRRQFGSANGTRKYRVRATRSGYVAEIDDLQTVAGLTVLADGVAVASGWELRPLNALEDGKAYTRIVLPVAACQVEITATPWGWTTVPDVVVEASLLQGSRFYMRRVAPFGVAGSPQDNSEVRLLERVDPDVAVMLRGYRRSKGLG